MEAEWRALPPAEQSKIAAALRHGDETRRAILDRVKALRPEQFESFNFPLPCESVPLARTKKFLLAVLNLKLNEREGAPRGFLHDYIDLLPHVVQAAAVVRGLHSFLAPFQRDVASAWIRPTPQARRFHLILLAARWTAPSIIKGLSDLKNPIPGDSRGFTEGAFFRVVSRATTLVDRMRHCADPKCKDPYFLAQRRSMKFCSKKCARFGKRLNKRAWWRKHGVEWRAERREAAAEKAPRKKATRKAGGKRGKK